MTKINEILNCEDQKNAAFEAVKNALPYVNPAETAILIGCLKDATDRLTKQDYKQAGFRFENAVNLAKKMMETTA